MNIPIDIRNLYAPIQPTIRATDELVTYQEIVPDTNLMPFIYCYWQLQTTLPLSKPFHYQVVADACIDIFFDLNNPTENFVMGFCKRYTEFPLPNVFNYVGVRFLPSIFPQLFNVNAEDLSNRFVELHQILPNTANFIANNFNYKDSLIGVKQKFDQYFLPLTANTDFNEDPLLYKAIHIILQNDGILNLEKDLNIGISQRQLRRLFKFYIGDTAKTFSKIVRFQRILSATPSSLNLPLNKIFFDQGFYDQAHFIKDFKNFYGITPTKAFGK